MRNRLPSEIQRTHWRSALRLPFLAAEKKPLHLCYAIADHPWVDSADGAAVRIALTVVARRKAQGILEKVVVEIPAQDGEQDVVLTATEGVIAPNLQVGADLSSCGGLKANKDLTNHPRGVKVIDAAPFLIGDLQKTHPKVYQHILHHIKPERDQNAREGRRKLWWAFGEPNNKLRDQRKGLSRYIATVETSKHRFFTFLDQEILPDNMLIAIASDDAALLGILSSKIHVAWALAQGGRLGMGNDPRYNKSRCFEPFPFPALEEGELKQRIRDLGERIDALRKRQQAQHPELTLTIIYNLLETLRAGTMLTLKERVIHEQGLVSILLQLHDELDAAVLEAYGWSDLSRSVGVSPTSGGQASGRDAHTPCEELLTRLVALNHARAAEEKTGLIRYLRPDYQNPAGQAPANDAPTLPGIETQPLTKPDPSAALLLWPTSLSAQVTAIQELIPSHGQDPETLAARFGKKSPKRTQQVAEILDTLRGLGKL